MNRGTLKATLVKHEGLRLKPYRDAAGKLTIGVGRNLDDVGISAEEAKFLLENDLARAEAGVRNALPWFYTLDEPRQHVLVNMAFNLGVEGLLRFEKMLRACAAGEYDRAAREMLASEWAGEVGTRAVDLAKAMREG